MTPGKHSPLKFFFFVMLLSGPFWLVGSHTDWEPLPGVPVSALMAVVPGLVALVLVAKIDGRTAAGQWLQGALDVSALRHGPWLLPAILLPPAILLATYGGMLLGGYELPEPQISAVSAAILLGIFLIPAIFEEVGWSSYALVKLQQRMTALQASLLIGVIWAAWHFIPLLQAGRSIEWIAWWSLTTIALRILITWIFNNSSGSALLAAFFHASENASWQSFPNQASHYDPAAHALVLWIVSCAVVLVFGRETLTRR
jgi:membrane protease YdiL (CAAX protease family)